MPIPVRRTIAAASAALVVLALAACGSGGSNPSAQPTSDDTVESVRILVVPTTDSTTIELAAANGIFKKHGLDVDVQVGQGGAAIESALQSGQAEFGVSDYVSILAGASHGLPLSIVAPLTVGNPETPGLYVMGDKGIDRIADLKGKNIGVISRGSLAELTTVEVLAQGGVAASEVNLVAVPGPNLVSALTNGQIDAVWLPQPPSLAAVGQGAKLLAPIFTGTVANLPVGGVLAANSWIQGHAGTIEKFRAALSEATDLYDSDKAKALQILPSFTSIDAATVAQISPPIFQKTISADELQHIADLMLKDGILTASLKAADVLAP